MKQIADCRTYLRKEARPSRSVFGRHPALSIASLVILGVLSSGCSSTFLTETNPEETWSGDRYRQLRHEDKQRFLGEDRNTSDPAEYVAYLPRKAWSIVEWSWNTSTGHSTFRYAADQLDKNPDVRRKAIYVLSDERFGRRDPYTQNYARMASEKEEDDPTVRAAAVRALNRSRDTTKTAVFITGLSDSNEWVRLEAAKALANIPDPKAVPVLRRLLAEEKGRDIRIACADALRCYKQSDVAQSLISVLSDRDFGTAWQSRRSLNLMTAQDFGYDQAAWLKYLTTAETPFVS